MHWPINDSGLGPRSEIDAAAGTYPFPYTFLGQSGDVIYKRLQVANDDLDPATIGIGFHHSGTLGAARYGIQVFPILHQGREVDGDTSTGQCKGGRHQSNRSGR